MAFGSGGSGFTSGFTGVPQGNVGGMPGAGRAQPTNGTQHVGSKSKKGKRAFVPTRKLPSAGSGVTGKVAAGATTVAAKTTATGFAKNTQKPAPPKAGAPKKARQSAANMKGAQKTPGPNQGAAPGRNNSFGGYGF